jgi:hypothetical protein
VTVRIVDFLEALVEDAELEKNYRKRPRQTMLGFGLTAEQGLVILGGTLAELRDAIQSESDTDAVIFFGRMGFVA